MNRIGTILLIGGQGAANVNQEVWLIQPQRTSAQLEYEGMCRSWAEVGTRHFAKYIQPWFKGTEFIADFEAVYGREEKTGHVLGYEQRLEAIQKGCPWLVNGFTTLAKKLIKAGVEVVAHTGRPNSTGWANKLIKEGRGLEVLKEFHDHDTPLFQSGVRIGRDNMADAEPWELDFAFYQERKRLGFKQQIEAIPYAYQTYWYGETCRIEWQLYQKRHVAGLPDFHRAGTPEFISAYPDVRVSVFPSAFGLNAADSDVSAPKDVRAKWLEGIRAGVQEMLRESANVTALLEKRIIETAVELGVTMQSFLPEGSK